MLEPQGAGLIANRFKPIRPLRHNVLHARDGRRHVAIELVPAADHDLAEMQRVIAIANKIEHPNLCRPREVLQHADQLVIVTELVEGISIGDRLMIGPFDPLQVGALMMELLSVLSRIHAEGIPHGGISPNTVMIDGNGALRLIDIGVVRGANRPTARLDIEAVGALAKTMLSGYLGSVPQSVLRWIARCSDQVRPFADAAAASAALIAPDTVVWTDAPRPSKMAGKKVTVPPKTERTESSVAIKIPTLDEPVKPLEVVAAEPLVRRSRTPSAMVSTAEAIALAATIKSELGPEPSAEPVKLPAEAATPTLEGRDADRSAAVDSTSGTTGAVAGAATTLDGPDAERSAAVDSTSGAATGADRSATADSRGDAGAAKPTLEVAQQVEALKRGSGVVAKPEPSRRPLIAAGLAAAALVALILWWTRGGTAEPDGTRPAVAKVAEPEPVRHRPPLPTAAVIVPDATPEPPRPVSPPSVPSPSPTPPPASTSALDVAFSPDSAWIETAGVYVLEEAYRQIVKQPLARIEVIGYSSADGKESRNAQLAVGRSLAVKKYLVERGVVDTRIAIVAKPNEPVADDPAARARSRRAEVRILPP